MSRFQILYRLSTEKWNSADKVACGTREKNLVHSSSVVRRPLAKVDTQARQYHHPSLYLHRYYAIFHGISVSVSSKLCNKYLMVNWLRLRPHKLVTSKFLVILLHIFDYTIEIRFDHYFISLWITVILRMYTDTDRYFWLTSRRYKVIATIRIRHPQHRIIPTSLYQIIHFPTLA